MAPVKVSGHMAEFTHCQEIDASPERVWEVLLDPAYVPEYAAGIEGAWFIDPPADGNPVGAKLGMVTHGGNQLMATIIEAEPGRCLVIEDQRGLRSKWEIVPNGKGGITLKNTLHGPVPPHKMDDLRYHADVKFQALAMALDRRTDAIA